MMMKTLRIIGLAWLAVSALVLASCGKDDDGGVTPPGPDGGGVTAPGQSEMEKVTGMRLGKIGNIRFEYDKYGRCVSAIDNDGDGYEIDWNRGRILPIYSDADDTNEQISFKTNGNGYVTEVSYTWNDKDQAEDAKGKMKMDLSYDKSGHLTEINTNSTSTGIDEGQKYDFKSTRHVSLTWTGGNLVNVKDNYEDNENGTLYKEYYNYVISYDKSVKNRFRQWCRGIEDDVIDMDILVFAHVGMFGVGTDNFPTNILTEYEEDGRTGSYNTAIKVQTNKEDLISTETVGNSTYNYYYDAIGGQNAGARK